MTDEGGTSERGSGPVGGLLAGLWGAAGSLVRAAGSVNPLAELPTLPEVATHPGAISSAQLTALRSTLKAQRDSIAAMQSQLRAFDEQLQVLERLLGPIAEWSAAWAQLEGELLPRNSAPAPADPGEPDEPDEPDKP